MSITEAGVIVADVIEDDVHYCAWCKTYFWSLPTPLPIPHYWDGHHLVHQ